MAYAVVFALVGIVAFFLAPLVKPESANFANLLVFAAFACWALSIGALLKGIRGK